MEHPSHLDLSDFEYRQHPGGAAHIEDARAHARPDLLFLSSHLGCRRERIEAVAKGRGVALPPDLQSPLFEALDGAVARIRAERRRDVLIYRLYCLGVTLALPLAMLLYIATLSIPAGALLGFLLVTYAFNVFHIRHHVGGHLYTIAGADKRSLWGRLDRWTAPLYDLLDETFMVTPRQWRDQHQASHHIFTNHAQRDFDVDKPYPLLRLHPRQARRGFHALQPLYAPLLLALNGMTFAPDNYLLKGGRLRYLVLHYGLLIALPTLLHGLGATIIAYLLTLGFTSLFVSYLFQVSHNATTVMAGPEPDFDAIDYEGWTRLQVEESVSYGGYLTTLLFGGINLQAEHHVAPAIEPTLLYHLRPELEREARARGFGYRALRGFSHAVLEYHRRLWALGRAEA